MATTQTPKKASTIAANLFVWFWILMFVFLLGKCAFAPDKNYCHDAMDQLAQAIHDGDRTTIDQKQAYVDSQCKF